MKKACPKCNGTGSIVVDTKICENCDGTGYVDTFEMKSHFKGVNSNARAKFDLDADVNVPAEITGSDAISVSVKLSVSNSGIFLALLPFNDSFLASIDQTLYLSSA